MRRNRAAAFRSDQNGNEEAGYADLSHVLALACARVKENRIRLGKLALVTRFLINDEHAPTEPFSKAELIGEATPSKRRQSLWGRRLTQPPPPLIGPTGKSCK